MPFSMNHQRTFGNSTTLVSDRNCRRNRLTDDVDGESGVPRLARITPICFVLDFGEKLFLYLGIRLWVAIIRLTELVVRIAYQTLPFAELTVQPVFEFAH